MYLSTWVRACADSNRSIGDKILHRVVRRIPELAVKPCGESLVDREYRVFLLENIKRDFNIDIEARSTPNEQTDSRQNRFGGWWNAHLPGWTDPAGLHETKEITNSPAEEMIDFVTLKPVA